MKITRLQKAGNHAPHYVSENALRNNNKENLTIHKRPKKQQTHCSDCFIDRKSLKKQIGHRQKQNKQLIGQIF